MPIYSKDMLAADIHSLRAVRQMTLAELAAKTGLSVSFLSDIECGRTNPSLSTLEKIATAYGMRVSISFLFSKGGERMGDARIVEKFQYTEWVLSPGLYCLFCGHQGLWLGDDGDGIEHYCAECDTLSIIQPLVMELLPVEEQKRRRAQLQAREWEERRHGS